MPRKRREKSGTDVYHVVSRGNNKQDILEQDSDKKYFMGLMKEKAAKYKVELYSLSRCAEKRRNCRERKLRIF